MTTTASASRGEDTSPSLQRILAGDVPVVLVHKSYQHSKRVPEALGYMASLHGHDLGLGVVVPVHNHTQNQVEQFVDQLGHVPFIAIDPELHYASTSTWEGRETANVKDDWTYFQDVPNKPKGKWVRRVLDAQRENGATVLLSASGWVDVSAGAKDLTRALTFVTESREKVGSDPMLVNLTLDSRWLADESLRSELFQEIVESRESHWYLRFYWPEVSVRYGQLGDGAILSGYRQLAELCALEDKQLFLPNTGLTGWISTALGATGFSTGQAWPEQAFAKQRVMGGRKGQPPPPRIPRYFDAFLLHTLEHSEYLRLAELDGHEDVVSQYSLEMDDQGHSVELAGLHYLMGIADLQAQLKGKRPEAKALRAVKRAESFLSGLRRADQPAGPNRPLHLAEWREVMG